MSRSVNTVFLLGHLGQNAEVKFTPSGVACTTFSLATNRRWKDSQTGEWKEAVDWHRCVLWRSEAVSKFLLKGKQIHVEGRLQTRSWDDHGTTRWCTEVIVSGLTLLGGGEGGGGAAAAVAAPRPQSAAPEPEGEPRGIPDDDVPF